MRIKVVGSSSKGNCYILDDGSEQIILEAGFSYMEILKALDFNFSRVIGTLVSHCHGDHSKGVKDLIKNGHRVLSSQKTFEALGVDSVYAYPIKADKWIKLGSYLIRPFEVKHDAPDTFGFMIKHPEAGNIVFITDTYYVPITFPEANHYFIEANYCEDILKEKYKDKAFLRDRIFRSHFSLQNCQKMLMANDMSTVRNIVLIHLSDSNSDEEKFKREIVGITGKRTYIAKAGMVINIYI